MTAPRIYRRLPGYPRVRPVRRGALVDVRAEGGWVRRFAQQPGLYIELSIEEGGLVPIDAILGPLEHLGFQITPPADLGAVDPEIGRRMEAERATAAATMEARMKQEREETLQILSAENVGDGRHTSEGAVAPAPARRRRKADPGFVGAPPRGLKMLGKGKAAGERRKRAGQPRG